MNSTDLKNSEKAKIGLMPLEAAHQLLFELHIRQHDLEIQNQKLKQELTALQAQAKKAPPLKESLFADIKRQDQTAKNLSPDKGLLRSIVDTVGDLIYVKDRNGVYRGCNMASEAFVGLKESEQIGKTDFDFFSQDLAEEILDTDRKILSSGRELCTERMGSIPGWG